MRISDWSSDVCSSDLAPHGREWRVTDELYNYRRNPRPRVHVVATVDADGYDGGTMGADHPIAWCHAPDKDRAWYTGLGHRGQMHADQPFRRHLLRGLRYAAGDSDACGSAYHTLNSSH